MTWYRIHSRPWVTMILGISVCVAAMGAAQVASIEAVNVVAVSGDSSDGAIPVHVAPESATQVIVISPYHYYRTPVESVETFVLAGDDSPIQAEAGTEGMPEIIGEPEVHEGVGFRFTIQAPKTTGNWIVSFRTTGIHDQITSGRRSRTAQVRISTRPPIADYVKAFAN